MRIWTIEASKGRGDLNLALTFHRFTWTSSTGKGGCTRESTSPKTIQSPAKTPAVEVLSRRCSLMGTSGLGTLTVQWRAMVQLRFACNNFHLGKEGNPHAID